MTDKTCKGACGGINDPHLRETVHHYCRVCYRLFDPPEEFCLCCNNKLECIIMPGLKLSETEIIVMKEIKLISRIWRYLKR